MSNSKLFGLVFLGALILSLSMVSCSSSSQSIPSSNYPVDLIGRVTIAKEVIENGTEDLFPPGSGWWIVQVSIRNKSYQIPINSKTLWAFVLANNPSAMAGVVVDLVQDTSANISAGESGELMLCCLAPKRD